MGQQIFDANGTFTVPAGITEVTLCMCGGGGSGAGTRQDSDAGGGHAGSIFSDVVTVGLLEVIQVTVGSGGASVNYTSTNVAGLPGSPTSFGTHQTVAGGNGGTSDAYDYYGNGDSRTTCGGTFHDGYLIDNGSSDSTALGGQAGAFGHGGNGGDFVNATDGGIGAGGGGSIYYLSGAGGNGRVVVNWDEFVEDGGLLINGTSIPELAADGGMQFYCDDHLGVPYVGPVHAVVIDGTEVWREI